MSSNNSFDPRNYLIHFEQAIQSKDFIAIFSDFLKERHGDEMIRFMTRVDSYSKDYQEFLELSQTNYQTITSPPTSPTLSIHSTTGSFIVTSTSKQQRTERQLRKTIKNLATKAKEIFDEFIELESSSELNLGATVQGKSLEKWDSILTYFNSYLKESGRVSEMIRHHHHHQLLDESDTISSNSTIAMKDLHIPSPDTITTFSSNSFNSFSNHSSMNGSGSSGTFDTQPSTPTTPTSPTISTTATSSAVTNTSQDKLALGISTLTSIGVQLEPNELFGQALLMISVDLKMSHFQCFSTSEMLLKFLREKGEKYTRTIGVDISKGYNVDLRFKPQDLRVPIITDDYIYFGLNLCEETPDWELKDSKKSYQVFTSKTSYLFDNTNTATSKGMKLSKIVIDLPYPIEDVWSMWCHTENQMEFDSMSYRDHVFHGYTPPNDVVHMTNKRDSPFNFCSYGLQKISCNFDLKLPMMKKRHMKMVGTTIHDSGTDMIMVVKHACDFGDEMNTSMNSDSTNSNGSTLSSIRNRLNVDTLLSYYVMFRCGEFKNSTRLYHIMYTDLSLPLQEFTLGKLMAKRASMLSKGMNKILEDLTYRGKVAVDSSNIVDQFGYSSAARDNLLSHPNRSWYNEWLEKKMTPPESSSDMYI